ncbi:MAG: hypothetical protein ABR555_05210 [Pyrinomonadaceae bacterium]
MKRSILVFCILFNISTLLALAAAHAQRRTQRTGSAQTPKRYLKDGVYKLKDKISFDDKASLTVALTRPDEWMVQAMRPKGKLLKLDATFGGDYALQFGQKTADNSDITLLVGESKLVPKIAARNPRTGQMGFAPGGYVGDDGRDYYLILNSKEPLVLLFDVPTELVLSKKMLLLNIRLNNEVRLMKFDLGSN